MEENKTIFEDFEPQLVQASSGKRFANYIIDLLLFYLIFFIIGILIVFISPDTISDGTFDSIPPFLDRLISLLLYGILSGIIEGALKGKTLGKYITGTRAVNYDGSVIDFKKGFIRGLCKAVPFNAFSALGSPCYPWHDKWTDTYVIDEKESNLESFSNLKNPF